MRLAYKDLTGRKYGQLTVLREYGRDNHKNVLWECRCDCGRNIYVTSGNLNSGNSTRCRNCLYEAQKERYEDLTGRKFGRLTEVKIVAHGPTKWECSCECGNATVVRSEDLKNGKVVSCGCFAKEVSGTQNYKHGKSNSRIFRIWANMLTRCHNSNSPSYANYGARGITVCEEWMDKENGFINFYNWTISHGYSEKLTLDRINVNGNYEPSNCRWATPKEQMNNMRRNRIIEYNGEKLTLKQTAEKYNMQEATIRHRLNKGWSVKDAIEKPLERKPNLNFRHMIFYKGKTQSLADWCRELDIPYGRTGQRINKLGWSIEKAFETKGKQRK